MPDDAHAQAPFAPVADEPVDGHRMPLTEHLEELRQCLIKSLIGLVVGVILSFAFVEQVIAIILAPAVRALQSRGETAEFLTLSPPEPFLLAIRVAIYSGLVVAMPWILHQAWSFISVGLYEKERRFAKRFFPLSVGLFVAGVAFMYFVVLPLVLGVLIEFSQAIQVPGLLASPPSVMVDADDAAVSGVQMPIIPGDPADPAIGQMWFNSLENATKIMTEDGLMVSSFKPAANNKIIASQYRLQDLVAFTLTLAIAFGVAFQLPVLVVFLAATGIVSSVEMSKARRFVLFGIIVASALLTPPDPASLMLLAAPMYVLFEAGLLFAKRFDVPDPA